MKCADDTGSPSDFVLDQLVKSMADVVTDKQMTAPSAELSAPPTDSMVHANGAGPAPAPTAPMPVAPASGEPAANVASDVPLDDETDRADLLTRFVVGLLVVGADELVLRLTAIQEAIDANPEMLGDDRSGHETAAELMRYLLVGMLFRTQRRIRQGLRRTFLVSLGTTGMMLDTTDRVTSSWLLRPFRRPVDAATQRIRSEIELSISKGRVEDRNGQALARQTIVETIDEFIDYISENPELAELISVQIGTQSVGLASSVVKSSRRISIAGDNSIEAVVRKILRMMPRAELPESPLVGKPQTMYMRDDEKMFAADDGRAV